MKVKDLIKELQKHNPNDTVVVNKDLWGYARVTDLTSHVTQPYSCMGTAMYTDKKRNFKHATWVEHYLCETKRKSKVVNVVLISACNVSNSKNEGDLSEVVKYNKSHRLPKR